MGNFLLGFLVGVLTGSLVNCLAIRSLGKQSFFGRSHCDKCRKKIRWYDLFPLISYAFLKGRCRFCKNKIPLDTVISEAGLGLIIGLIFQKALPVGFIDLSNLNNLAFLFPDILFKVFVVSVLMILFITDIKKGLIPDRITKPSVVIALLFLTASSLVRIGLEYTSLRASQLGQYLLPPYSDYFQRHALIAMEPLIMALLSASVIALFFSFIILITKGRGMGGGDLKLGFFIGLALGFPLSVLAIFLAFVLGSVVGLFLIILKKRSFGQTIPFGPFLSLGSILALLWGQEIISYYLGIKLP